MRKHRMHMFSGHGDVDRDPRSHLLLDLAFADEEPVRRSGEPAESDEPDGDGGSGSAQEPSPSRARNARK